MGLPQDPQYQVDKATYEQARIYVANGHEWFIYAFQTPDGAVAYRMTAKEIVESVEKGQMVVV